MIDEDVTVMGDRSAAVPRDKNNPINAFWGGIVFNNPVFFVVCLKEERSRRFPFFLFDMTSDKSAAAASDVLAFNFSS